MPAYIQHHEAEIAAIVCPTCRGPLAMHVRDVEPHWSMAKIDFTYECSDCGTEVKKTVTKPERQR
jgi:C4-type Zn-finger protein